jgi:hypothetical protein
MTGTGRERSFGGGIGTFDPRSTRAETRTGGAAGNVSMLIVATFLSAVSRSLGAGLTRAHSELPDQTGREVCVGIRTPVLASDKND